MKKCSFPHYLFISLSVLFVVTFLSTTMVLGQTVQLPRTGQTKCYDTAGTEISCAGTGQDGEIRAGVAWPNPRFTSGTGDESDCMIDNLTGLMWPKNGNLFEYRTWDWAMTIVNDLTHCGHSDWRLPNINELESLINVDVSDSATWLNGLGFYDVQLSSGYWSSTAAAEKPSGWRAGVDMSGYVIIYGVMYGNYVLPVRATTSGAAQVWKTGQTTSYWSGDDGDLETGVSWPSPRFSNHGNGTVTDNLTGLMWTKDANTPGSSACSHATYYITWQGAVDHVACLNAHAYLGYTDWRIPNRKELLSLIDWSQYDPALPSGHPFDNVQDQGYWSSTAYAIDTDNVWSVYIPDGRSSERARFVSADCLWPVRAGQVEPPPQTACDTAKPISVNSEIDGSIETAGQETFYKIQAPHPGLLVLYTTGKTDTVGELRDAQCSPIASDNNNGLGRNFKIAQRIQQGIYYVMVKHSNPRRTGEYTLNADLGLLTTTWAQASPFKVWFNPTTSDSCHRLTEAGVLENEHGDNMYSVGCTAVALGQLINYYFQQGNEDGWLDTLLQDVTVFPRFTKRGNNLLECTYTDGFATEDSYPDFLEDQETPGSEELRKFLWTLAVGLDSNFTKGSTGVGPYVIAKWPDLRGMPQKVASLLRDRFRFNSSLTWEGWLDRLDEARDSIKASIDKREPVLTLLAKGFCDLDLVSCTNGHTVVIDAYKIRPSDGAFMVHINMGWGGKGDGWYPTDNTFKSKVGKYKWDQFVVFSDTTPVK